MKKNASLFQRLGRVTVRAVLTGLFAWALALNAPAALTHRYSFTTDASDSVGGANGTLMNGATISGGAAHFSSGIAAGPTCDYIDLGPNLISSYTTVTFEFWCNVGVNNAIWEELYAFGNQDAGGAGANMLMFTPHSGGPDYRMSYAQADPGYNDEHLATATPILDGTGARCITCVYDPPNNTMTMYNNGVPVATLSPVTAAGVTPQFSLANIINNYSWLGRSLYNGDGGFLGSIDEFRIYDAPLTALQVLVDNAAGPDRVVADPGAYQSLSLSAANLGSGASEQAQLLAAFANIANVPVTYYASNWVSSDPTIISVDTAGRLTAVSASAGSTTISAMWNGQIGIGLVSVSSVITNLTINAPAQVTMGGARLFNVVASYSDGSTADLTTSCTYSSSAPTVLSVIAAPTGSKLAGLTNGAATLTAHFGAKSATAAVTVAPLSLTHRWSFNDPPTNPDGSANTNVMDSVNAANGSLMGAAFLPGDGTVYLDGGSSYVQFPVNLFTNYGAATFEAWVTADGNNWERIYDFGLNNTRYMFLSLPSGDNNLRGAYTIGGGGTPEQIVQMNGLPAAGVQHHIVWTGNGASYLGALYVDGLLVGTNGGLTLTPEDIGPTTNNWLGRSQYPADPYFLGSFDEFRVYDGPLDPLSIAINDGAGPDVITSTPGALTSLALTVNSPMLEQDSQQVTLAGNFANVANVPLTTCPQVQYSSSNTKVATVDAYGTVTATGPGNATISAVAFGQTATAPITVNPVPVTLTHRWSFSEAPGSATVHDSVGNTDANVVGNVVLTGTTAVFDGVAGDYIWLPNDLFVNYNSISFEAWFTDNGSGVWGRLIDIGNGTAHYMYLDAVGPGGNMRAAYNAGSGENNNVITYGAQPAINKEHHVVLTQDALSHTARIWVDGVKVAENQNFTARPKDVGTTPLSFFGKSQYNDPYFEGNLDEVRTWQGALSPQQILLDYFAGPDNLITSPGTPTAVTVTATNMVAGYLQQANAFVSFAGLANVPMTGLATNWVSSNPAALKVSSSGLLTAVGAGTATISATCSGVTGTSAAITVAAAPLPVLAHRYSFNTDASDSIAGANGTLMGNAAINNGSVVLDGSAGTYVQLPGHLFDGFSEVTFETWFTYPTGNAGNARIWDFGTPASTIYFGYTPLSGSANSIVRYNFGTGEATMVMPGATGTSYNTNFVHLVVTVSPLLGSVNFYVNGQWKETFPWTTPLSTIVNTIGFLGHAVTTASPPGNFTGQISEFRIWNCALNQLQIQANYVAGPDGVVTAPGGAQSVNLVLNDTKMVVGAKQRPQVSVTFGNLGSVDLTAYPGVVYSSANSAVVKVNANDQLEAVGVGTAAVSASFGGQSASAQITVVPKALTLTHRYSFKSDARDSIGHANGTLYGQAAISGGQVVFNGVRNPQTYVQLPRDLVAGYDAMTVEAWATIGGNGTAWERLFDFGNHINTTGYDYVYYSPYSGASGNTGRLGVSENTMEIAEIDADCAGLRSRTLHIVGVVDGAGSAMTVYTNGVLASTYTGPLPVTLAGINDVYNFLGRSQFNDPWFIGSIDEFRVYYGVMSAAQAAASFAAGTNPDVLTVAPGNGVVTITWPVTPVTSAYSLYSSPAMGAGAVWSPVTAVPLVVNGMYVMTVPVTAQEAFFGLSHN